MADGPQLTRRRFLEAGAAASALAAMPAQAPAAERPNFVLLVIDSLRADHVGAYGGRARTPNIDSLARAGLRFTRAYPEAMATVPARRSIMTGRRVFPFRGWHRGEDGMPGWEVPGWEGIDDVRSTFTSVLRRAGYWTAYITDNPHIAHARAFSRVRGSFSRYARVAGQAGHAPRPARVSDAELRHWLPPDMYRNPALRVRVRNYLSHGHYWRDDRRSFAARVFGLSAKTLEEAVLHQPFALVVDCFDPHEPWTPPRRYIDMYGDRRWRGPEPGSAPYSPVRDWLRDRRLLPRMRHVYAAEVTMTDRWLGTFLRRLGELGLAGNTVIVLVSDHGILLGEYGWTGKTAYKLHPELIHVPFLLVDPRRPGRKASSYPASTHDIGPTLLAMAGVPRPRGMNGFDLSPLLAGGRMPRRELAWGGYGNWFYARTERWALTGSNRLSERRLYDLERDPRERRNVVRRHPRTLRELTARYVAQAGRNLPFYD